MTYGVGVHRHMLIFAIGERLTALIEALPTLGDADDLDALLPWCWKATLPV